MSAPARFHLISGNRLDALAAELGARLAQADVADSLQPDTILVPQPSLRQWLQQTLAERHGIAANLDLLTPSEFVWRLLRAANESPLPEASPWDRDRLRWRLYALLGRLGKQELPVAVRRYLQRSDARNRDEGARALARLGLAESLAGAFDRYQAYRRDWLDAWQRGEDRDDWQAALWRALCRDATSPHRAALIGDWLARYDRRIAHAEGMSAERMSAESIAPPPGLPSRLAAFGTIHVSPDVLHLLAVAGQWCALDFYLPTPSAEYWGDVQSLRERLHRDGPAALPAALADLQRDNPPLAAWGGGGRDILAQLFSYEIVQPETEIECFVDPGRDTLLHRLQQDVLRRAAPITEPWSYRDRSVQIHACHSKLREIEVLHDRLRAMLDDETYDPPLQPREIAVMAPNIGEYLPLARAVFGGLDADDPRYIPFTLADRPHVQGHGLIGWFLGLLDLGDTPLRVGDFRDLIALPSVMQTLGLSHEALARLDAWFAAAGIRWGEDADARERAGVGRWREYSFDFGFERLLTGYAAGDDAGPWRDAHGAKREDSGEHAQANVREHAWIAPYTELEGGDAEVLDRALDVYARLRVLAAWMREPHPAAAWRERLSETALALIGANAQDSAEAQARRWLLDALDALAEDAAEAGALPLAVVREALKTQLSQASAHQPWLAGGVTFAGMVPLRTVPFRVVCLLGLDADAFPRREPAQDIDRLVDAVQGRAPRRLGDRSVREDDRFLFLQWLCAAGDVFYLSYGGRDARDGSLREPAAPIAELLDTLERMDGGRDDGTHTARATRLRAHIVLEHPLQPFSPRAFGEDGDTNEADDPRRFSYRDEWRVEALATGVLNTPPPFVDAPLPPRAETNDETIALTRDALQAFFANPAKAWLNERLGLRLPGRATVVDDREPLGGDGLQRHDAIAALLRTPRIGDEADEGAQTDAPQTDEQQTDEQQAEKAADTRDDLLQALRARAALAPGRDGEAVLDDALPLAQALRRAARKAVAATTSNEHDATAASAQAEHALIEYAPTEHASTEHAPIEFAFHDVRRDRDGHPLRVLLEAGKLDGKRRLRAGLDHLLLASLHGAAAYTVLIGEGEKSKASSKKTAADAEPAVEIVVFGGLDAETAQARLRKLRTLRDEGRDAPLPFAPKAAWAYVEALRKNDGDTRAAWRAAEDAFAPNYGDASGGSSGEAADPHLALAFRPDGLFDAFDSPRAQRFRALALAVFDALPMATAFAPMAFAQNAAVATSAADAAAKPSRSRRTPAEPAA